jgi:hypothetical protein
MEAARKSSRYGHRDATMILIATAMVFVGPRSAIFSGTKSSSTPVSCTYAGLRERRYEYVPGLARVRAIPRRDFDY